MKNTKLRKYVLISLLAAITFVITGVIPSIPLPGTGGYVHLGDSIIIVASMLFGPFVGALTGAIGSTLADVYKFPIYAPATFIIKGLMGFIIGRYCYRIEKVSLKSVIAFIIGGIILVSGYYFAEAIISGNLIAPISNIIFSVLQYVLSLIFGVLLYKLLNKKVSGI